MIFILCNHTDMINHITINDLEIPLEHTPQGIRNEHPTKHYARMMIFCT